MSQTYCIQSFELVFTLVHLCILITFGGKGVLRVFGATKFKHKGINTAEIKLKLL